MGLLTERLHKRILQKKKKLDDLRPLPSTVVRKLRGQMQIEYIYNSNAIEGNTLTLRETQLVLEEGITVGGKPLREIMEVRNHPEAIEFIENVAKSNELKEEYILTVHQIIMKNSIEDAGRYRTREVRIAGTNYMPPPAYEVPFEIRGMIEKYNRNPDEFVPIELAAWVHHKLVQIHPFHDGNGRVARLLSNLTLLHFGYPMTVILRVDRKRYYDTLRKADKENLAQFANFIASAVEQALDTYLRAIDPAQDPLIPISEASKGTPYSPEYLSLLARTRRIPATKIGKKWLVSKSAIQEYISQQNHSASAKQQVAA